MSVRSRLIWGICAAGLVALFIWSAALPGRTPPVFPEGDPAVIELYTWQACHGLWAYGPYSRFGWHHPGPLYFYLLAPFYAASGHHTLALDAGAFAINLVTLTIAVWALVRFARTPMALAVLVALAGYVFEVARLLTSVWNPHVLLVPFGALIVIAAMVMAGRLALLPILLAIGSFAAQSHAGLLPVVIVVCLSALAGGLWQTRQRRWFWLALSAGLLALLWALPIMEQLTAPTGNLTAMVHFFGPSGPAGAGISFSDAVIVWADTLTAAARAEVVVPYGNVITISPSLWRPMLAALEVLLLGLAAWHLRRRQRDIESALALICAIASVVGLVSIARIRGGLVDHLVGWVTLLGVLNIGVLIGTALTWIDERSPGIFRRLAPIAALAGPALVIGVAWYGAARLEFQRQEVVRKSTGGRTPTQALYQELRVAMTRAKIQKPLIHAAVLSWPQAAGIALQLTKRESPFASDLVWLFGPQVTPRGDEDADVTVADTPTRHTLSQRPGDCMILERHGTSLHLLAVPPERFATIACTPP